MVAQFKASAQLEDDIKGLVPSFFIPHLPQHMIAFSWSQNSSSHLSRLEPYKRWGKSKGVKTKCWSICQHFIHLRSLPGSQTQTLPLITITNDRRVWKEKCVCFPAFVVEEGKEHEGLDDFGVDNSCYFKPYNTQYIFMKFVMICLKWPSSIFIQVPDANKVMDKFCSLNG